MTSRPRKIRVAVLLVPPVQLLDFSPVDLFFMLSKSYLRDCQLPQPLIDRGLDEVEILYVAEESSCTVITTAETTTTTTPTATTSGSVKNNKVYLANLTADVSIKITHILPSTTSSPNFPPEISPGALDILLVPGPDPSNKISETVKKFLLSHAEIKTTHILSICTGIFVLGQAGILDGKSCTGPRPLISLRLKKEFPHALFNDSVRWEIDSSGRLWTAGGITNGQEMVAAYLRSRFDPELADLVTGMADVGEKTREYDSTKVGDGIGFVWILARSLVKNVFGLGGKGVRK